MGSEFKFIQYRLFRVTEAMGQWHRFPVSALVFTGAKGRDNPKSNAWVAAEVVKSLGVPQQQSRLVTTAKDPQQEAKAVNVKMGQARFLLVTSASPMPRAVELFHAFGLNPIPVPANQLANLGPLNLEQPFIPQAYWLSQSEKAGYE